MKPWLDPEDTLERPATPLKRPPVGMHNAVGAELGNIMRLDLTEHRWDFHGQVRAKPRLVWFPKQKVLGWWTRAKAQPATEDNVFALDQMTDIGPALRMFEVFNDRRESGAYTFHMPFRSTRDWYSMDRAVCIKYWSDRFGKTNVDYVHDFRAGTRLYVYGSPRPGGPAFWILKGGGLKVTAHGIE